MNRKNRMIKILRVLVLMLGVGMGILVAFTATVRLATHIGLVLTSKRLEHVMVTSVDYKQRADGSARYTFVVTNGQPGAVVLRIRSVGMPQETNGYDARFLKTLATMSSWSCTVDLPKEPQFVDLLCLRSPRSVERKIRRVGASLQLCSARPRWMVVKRIELPK